MSTSRTHAALTGLLAALALAVAGCGASPRNAGTTAPAGSSGSTAPPSPSATTTQATQATTSSTPTATTPATTPSATGTTTGNSGGVGISGSACTAADLTPAFLNSNGATGHVVIAFTLKNTGSGACDTYGFPGVQFLSKSGAPLATDATRTTTDFAGHVPERQLTLAPGQEASFRIVTDDVASSQSACVNAYGLQIIAPDDTATMRASMPQPISVCNGKATVSPLAAGTSASST